MKWFQDPDPLLFVLHQDPVQDPVISLLNKFEKQPEPCGVRGPGNTETVKENLVLFYNVLDRRVDADPDSTFHF
jgi:hypothetical protein